MQKKKFKYPTNTRSYPDEKNRPYDTRKVPILVILNQDAIFSEDQHYFIDRLYIDNLSGIANRVDFFIKMPSWMNIDKTKFLHNFSIPFDKNFSTFRNNLT